MHTMDLRVEKMLLKVQMCPWWARSRDAGREAGDTETEAGAAGSEGQAAKHTCRGFLWRAGELQ